MNMDICAQPQRRAATAASNRFVVLATSQVQLVLDVELGGRPGIVYWGKRLTHASPQELALLSLRQWAHGGAAEDIAASLSNELGTGVSGPPGFIAQRAGHDWATIFRVVHVESESASAVRVECEDANSRLRATYDLKLDPSSHVVSATTNVVNLGQSSLSIDWCAALCIPLNRRLTHLTGLTGRWAMEFQTQKVAAFQGSYLRENKSGRTSHDNFPGLIAGTAFTSEKSESAAAFHLGWSGNNRVRVDRHSDGRAFLQMGELFHPGEMVLAPGGAYTTPPLYAVWSEQGFNQLSQRMHRYVRERVIDPQIRSKPRPVHYNTWEAVYFDHSEARLFELAEHAAHVGAERFVLDDGWFSSRRSDDSGLGDWWVAENVYPNGLRPLADHVRKLGMEFGLWFEPEMVNPDSDLYRRHPDWVLEASGVEQVPSRNQLSLDLTRRDVVDYLFTCVSQIVEDCQVAYIKWDMNRDIHHPGSAGRGAIHRQTHAVYALMHRLRDAHPGLEIETCSSGGARADFGVLEHTDRIWVSDSNDALDRQKIQRGASYFFPLCVMGSHVGPRQCHITRRTLSMSFRAATALFGHMGIELNLAEETAEDLEILRKAVELYKEHRTLLHEGELHRLDAERYLNIVGVVAGDRSEAIFSCAKVEGHTTTLPGRFRLAGLASDKFYRTTLIWPSEYVSVTTPSLLEMADLSGDGWVFSGEALLSHGIQLPLMYPESCLVFRFVAVNGPAH
ncbi:MAG: alpha-galactosidase [Pseudomonadota bacterium]